jgi:hypothetical protein
VVGTSLNYCPYCGKKILKSNKYETNFCRYCGKALKKEQISLQNKVQCTVCHEYIWHGRIYTIQCSFCGSHFHYSCVVSWLMKYNSCPMCQNEFLNPSLSLSEKGVK